MSGNGKQVQLPSNQTQRFTCIPPTRPLTQRADGFSVPSGGVGGGYVTSGPGGHHIRISQSTTPPQDIKPQMYPQQPSVRTQQYPQQTYRGAPPQTQTGVVHHQSRPALHHRQQAPGPAASTPTPWPNQQVMYATANMPLYIHPTPHMTLPQASYPQQQPTRQQYFQQSSQHSMMMPQHASYYCQPAQPQYVYHGSTAPGRGGPSPGQMAPAPNVPQQPQSLPYVPSRFPSPMTHPTLTNEKKSRSHAIPIIDPKSGKEIDNDNLANSNENNPISQTDESSSISQAVVEEFARRVTEIAKEKDNNTIVDNITKNDETSSCVIESVCFSEQLESNQDICNNDISVDKVDSLDVCNEEKLLKHTNLLPEINETPVVSAVSNSPEIVLKQCHINKQKQMENISIENKKNQAKLGKPAIQSKPSADAITNDDDSFPKKDIHDTKEFGAQQILTSALQPAKSINDDNTSSEFNKDINHPHDDIVKLDSNHLFLNSAQSENIDNSLSLNSEPVITNTVPIDQNTISEEDHAQPDTSDLSKTDCIADPGHLSSAPVETICKEEEPIINLEDQNKNIKSSETPSVDQVSDNVELIVGKEENLDSINNESNNVKTDEIEHKLINKDVNAEENINSSDTVEPTSALSNSVSEPPSEVVSTVEDDNKTEDSNPEKSDDKPKGPVLRYSYKEDQWSPLNVTGKKQYDTDFLMALKNDPNSKKRPENLTQTDILAENTNRQSRNIEVSRPVPNNDLLPTFAKSNVHNVTPNRKSQHGKPIKDPKGIPVPGQGAPNRQSMIHVNLSLRSEVKLNESENAWKPSRIRQDNLSEEEVQTRELCKTFRSTLNKLTPQNFDNLISQVRKLNINSEDRFSKVIDLVFEKAIDEPNFSLTYALMCKELAGMSLASSENSEVSFRALIIKKCQNEFEKNDDTAKKMQKDIDECTDPEKKKEMILNLEEVESKIRRRSVGNVRFIGEIFKQNLIRPHIVIGCINHLLSKIEEETLECLCKLLTTIGKDLEKKYKENLQPYFKTMKDIVDNKRQEISSRVRFMLQDVIDLRLNNWVPRQQAVNPKTMDQIKLEVEQEQNKSSIFPNYSSPALPRKDDRPNNLNKRGGSKSVTEEGWSQASNRNSRNKTTPTYTIDSGKLSKMYPDKPVTMTSLQPHGVSQNTWGKGSTVSKKLETVQLSSHNKPSRNSSSSSRKPAETSNSYLLLENDSDNNASEGSARNVNYKSKRASIERSTFKSSESDDQIGGPVSEAMDKIKTILEYAHSDTAYGMLGRIQDHIKSPSDYPILCRELMLWGIGYKECKNMQTIGQVTGTLVDDDLISSQEFLKELKHVVDVSTNAPHEGTLIWKMFGVFIWAHMKRNNLTLEQIHSAFSNALKLEYGFDILSAIFAERLKVLKDVKNLWLQSSLTLEDWMNEDNVSQFLEEFNWPWLRQKTQITPQDTCSLMLQQMRDGKSRDEVKEWISKNVGSAEKEGWFVRALTEAIHIYGLCFEDPPRKPTLDTNRLEKFYPLLSSYISGHEEQELECLFAIQKLMNKYEHPQGITGKLFEYLWDCGDIVSLEAISTWEKNDDPKEQEGKGVMLKTLTSFLTSIKSEDPSSDEASAICEEGY